MVSEEFSNLGSVGAVFMDAEFDILGELFVEFLVIFGVFSELSDHLDAFFDDVFLDDLKDLVLLEEFSGDVEGQVLRVDHSLNETEKVGDQFFTVVHDEHSSDVEFNVVSLLLGLEKIERSSLGNKENALELKLTFDGELFDSQVVFPVVGKGLVEGRVFFLGNSFGLSHPNGFVLVLDLEFGGHFLYFLSLFLSFLLLFNFDIFSFLLLFRFFLIIILNFLFSGLLDLQLDFEVDELAVFLDEVLNSLLLKEFQVIRFHVQNDLGTSGESVISIILNNCESSS
jgi:hypothetical protein